MLTSTLAAQIMKRPDILARLHLVEALLVLGIILVPASIFLRVAYGPEMLSLEDRSMESLGIPAWIYRITIGASVFIVLIIIAVRDRIRRHKDHSPRYRLPDE